MVTLVSLIGFNKAGSLIINLFDLNKILRYRYYPLSHMISDIDATAFSVFFIGYLILNFARIRTNLYISGIHFLLMSLSSFLYNFWELDLRILLSLYAVSAIVFGANVYTALSNRKSTIQ